MFTCFNLSFKRPKTDTCDICNKYTGKIDHGTEEEKEVAKNEKELHLRRAEAACLAKDTASKVKDDSHIAICFDLQKTMPTSNLTNQKAYYFRQLWTYNLSIHNLTTNTANMFMWHEGQASRVERNCFMCT